MTSEPKVLNRLLYRRLVKMFGNVKVRSRGESYTEVKSLDVLSGKTRYRTENSGEYYAVCCPLCNDTRFRCYINHMYGTTDPVGRERTHLVYCYNAGCSLSDKTRKAYEKLEEMLTGKFLTPLVGAEINKGVVVDLDKVRSNWPGDVIRVDKLPPNHAAVRYLTVQRGFDVNVVGKFYNVHLCTSSDRRICEDRLIIPIYHRKKMVGWQARAAYECDWKESRIPKYYTAPGTPKAHILYNLGNASKYRTGVIVEGVTDVWRVGPQAVCSLGASLSTAQVSLFVRMFRGYGGILLEDGDVQDNGAINNDAKVTQITDELGGKFSRISLPERVDPADMHRDWLRKFMESNSSFKLNWRRRYAKKGRS